MQLVADLKLRDIASREVFRLSPDTLLEDAIRQFAERRVSSLVVVEDDRPVGIVTEYDLLCLASRGAPGAQTVRAIMSSPLLTARGDSDFAGAYLMIAMRGFRHLILVDEQGKLDGVASESDFFRALDPDLLVSIAGLKVVIDPGFTLMSPDMSMAAALQLMVDQRLDHLLVGQGGNVAGIFTEREIVGLLARRLDPARVALGEMVAQSPRSINGGASVADAARQMAQFSQRNLLVRNADGRLAGVISQHRLLEHLGIALAEESRVRLQGQLAFLLEATGTGVWELDIPRQMLIRGNAVNKLMKLEGNPPLENLQDAIARVHPDDRALVSDSLRAMMAGGADSQAIEYRTTDGLGQLRWVSSRGYVVERDAAGKPARLAGVTIDIDGRKQTELSLRESESRFRGLLEEIPLALCYYDANDSFLFINQRFRETCGYSLSDVPSLTQWWQLAYPDASYRQWVIESWTEGLRLAREQDSAIPPVEYAVTCKDGQVRYMEISGVALGDNVLSTFIDVTERRQQQALLVFSNAVLHHISIGAPLHDVLDFIAREIEGLEPGIFCTIHLLDATGKFLRNGAAPSLPKAYAVATDRFPVGEGSGFCGTAVARRERVFVGDIAGNPQWSGTHALAAEFGLAACWSSPVFSSAGNVLGTFAIYWRTPQTEVGSIIRRFVETATSLTNVAMESTQRDSSLRTMHQDLLRAEAIGGMGSWTWDFVGRRLQWSKQMHVLFGLDPNSPAPSRAGLLSLLHADDRLHFERVLDGMLQGIEPAEFDFRLAPQDGETRYLKPTFAAMRDEQGKVTGFEGTVIDITTSRLAEIRLHTQLDELRRWQQITLGREGRVLELKREVNELLARLGESPRYGSVIEGGGA